MKPYSMKWLVTLFAFTAMSNIVHASDIINVKANALLQQQISVSTQSAIADRIENTLLDTGTADLLMSEIGRYRDQPNAAYSVQDGSGNETNISQEGGANTVKAVQMGNRNDLTISQDGIGNIAQVAQFGNSNSVELTQVGNFNYADITQYNQNNHVGLTQRGIGLMTKIEQSGNQSVTIERVQSGF